MIGGGFGFPSVFIAHASSSPHFPEWLMDRYWVAFEIRQAVQDYLNRGNSPGPSRQVIERCLAACRLLDNLSDEDWAALEPLLVEEIAVLHNLRVLWK